MAGRKRLLLATAAAIVVLVAVAGILRIDRPIVMPREEPPEQALSWNDLRNTDYPSDFPRGKVARLAQGAYEEEYVPGSATKLKIQMADFGAFGQIDEGQSVDAAVLLVSDPGGSGTFTHLVAALNRDGKPVPSKPVLLGDRIAVRAIRIEDRKISLRMRVRSPSDPYARLTREVTRTYSLVNGELILETKLRRIYHRFPSSSSRTARRWSK
ncbi:MAG: hypothetical protein Q7O66_05965 [Dehalococcoidia bacterium]|nr:hypothetical protein [Dehalococcoidia bacterium]